jgi:2-C-methyl-D-erythritol 4-phosphate cytidylyltransferase
MIEKNIPFSVILLAGGVGTRMRSKIPKQYLLIHNKPLALYSFEVFLSLPEVEEIIVVCDQEYEHLFNAYQTGKRIAFASPGFRRQDSVYNGIQKLNNPKPDRLICIHDAARPFIDATLVRRVVHMAEHWDAAVAGVQVKSTIKLCDSAQIVVHTLDRSHLWEMQTPQVINLELLKEGFDQANEKNLTVTDDVSLVELIGKPVKVVEGSYNNIKVTTPEDLILVQQYIEKNALLQTDNRL